MSSVKKQLTAALQAIGRKNYAEALAITGSLIDDGVDDLNCWLCRGKAFLSLGSLDDAEEALNRAVALDPTKIAAWQGLFAVHAERGILTDAALNCTQNYITLLAENFTKNRHVIRDKIGILSHMAKKCKDTALKRKYYTLVLPGSPIFEVIEPFVPLVHKSYEKLISVVEAEEEAIMKQNMSSALMRVPRRDAATKQKLSNELTYALRRNSPLLELYPKYYACCDDTTKRRQVEAKRFQLEYALLLGAPQEEKEERRRLVLELASDIVTVQNSFCLGAWSLHLEVCDPLSLTEAETGFSLGLIDKFLELYPRSQLAAVLSAYLDSDLCPFPRAEVAERKAAREALLERKARRAHGRMNEATEESNTNVTEVTESVAQMTIDRKSSTPDTTDTDTDADMAEDKAFAAQESAETATPELAELIAVVTEALGRVPSVIGYRILVRLLLLDRQYEAGLQASEAGLELVAQWQESIVPLPNALDDLTVGEGTCYTNFQPPRHFSKALELFDKVLTHKPHDTEALIGKGLVLVEKRRLDEAERLLSDLVEAVPESIAPKLELGWCQVLLGKHNEGRKMLQTGLQKLQDMADTSGHVYLQLSQTSWRLAESFWREYHETEADKNDLASNLQNVHTNLLQALKFNQNNASAYALLGDFLREIVQDESRALRCYHKAFELEGTQLGAAKQLLTHFVGENQWALVDVVVQKLEKSLGSGVSATHAWIYRVAGLSALTRKDLESAIAAFQAGIRVAPHESAMWFGLGEAYYQYGRYDASLKVFLKAQEIAPSSYIQFRIAEVYCLGGEYIEAQTLYESLIQAEPENQQFLLGYVTCLNRYGQWKLSSRDITAGVNILSDAIEAVASLWLTVPASAALWTVILDVCRAFLAVPNRVSLFPFRAMATIFQLAQPMAVERTVNSPAIGAELRSEYWELIEELTKADGIDIVSQVPEWSFVPPARHERQLMSLLLQCAVQSGKFGVIASFRHSQKTVVSDAWHNLAMTYLAIASAADPDVANCGINVDTPWHHLAELCLKKAVKLSNSVPEYWNGLGLATMSVNARVAQHCFIKCLSLNAMQFDCWLNFALLCIQERDFELATESLSKARTQQPSSASLWIAEAFLSLVRDSNQSANTAVTKNLFTLAYNLSGGRHPISRLLFGHAVAQFNAGLSESLTVRHEYMYAVDALVGFLQHSLPSGDPTSSFVLAARLVVVAAEKAGDYELAAELLAEVSTRVEEAYEECEDNIILWCFAWCKTTLARLRLAAGQPAAAVTDALIARDILDEEIDTNASQGINLNKLQLACHVTTALALYLNEQFDEALTAFHSILERAQESPELVTFVARALWAQGGEEEKEVAFEQLGDDVEARGPSHAVTVLLTAMAVADGNSALQRVCERDLVELSVRDASSHYSDPRKDVEYLLTWLKRVATPPMAEAALLQPYRTGVFADVSSVELWKEVDVSVALELAVARGSVAAEDLSQLYVRSVTCEADALRVAQRAVVLSPWNVEAWQAVKASVEGN